jgi:hypothetical protein
MMQISNFGLCRCPEKHQENYEKTIDVIDESKMLLTKCSKFWEKIVIKRNLLQCNGHIHIIHLHIRLTVVGFFDIFINNHNSLRKKTLA